MNAENQLRGYLEQCRVKKGEPSTHTTMSPSGNYYIGEDVIEPFITVYCNAIRKGIRPTVTERPGAYGPLRADFDLKASLDEGLKRKYTDHILTSIIKLYQDEIKNSVLPEDYDDKMLTTIVLEKKAPRVQEGVIKDGFHLHFPFFICEGWFQDEYLRTKITAKMAENKLWEGIKYSESVDKFIDTGMSRKPWLMYGSAKAEGAEPYMATRAYGADLNPVTLDEVFEEEMVGRKSSVDYYLPRFLSVRGYPTFTKLKPEMEAKRSAFKPKKIRRGVIAKKRSTEDVLEDIKLIKDGEIMAMLSDDRCDEYNSWIDVGWTLFNIGQGCDEALQLWIDFSRRSPKFVDGDCEERWSRMEMRDKTIGSLLAMARSDNPDRYKEWKDANIKTHLHKSLTEKKPNEWDVAQVIWRLYKDRFLCADAKKDIWYEFINHRWQFVDDGVALRRLLATEVVDLYYKFRSELAAEATGKDETERKKIDEKIDRCRDVITGLKTVKFQERLLKMCKVVFHNPLFFKKMDENRMLFVCDNGVLDLELLLFRDGRPDDYMTFSCNVPYPKDSTHDDDEVKEVDNYLRKVFPNKNLRDYFLDTSCATMEGGNVNKNFVIGTGIGDNAKTVTYSFLEMSFGDYCMKFPRDLFIQGRGNASGSARPELARVRGKRLALTQEIAKTETLNIGVLKELTGNDSFFARGLFEKGADIRPMFTLFMACNEPPKVPGHDDATWNRIRVLDYESKFVKPKDLDKYPVPEDEEEQFKMKRFKADPSFMRKLPELAPYFIWILFERFKHYKKNGLKEPVEVQMSTNAYRAMNDVYLQFVDDRIRKVTPEEIKADVNQEKYFLKIGDLHDEFIEWYHENHSSYTKEKFSRITLIHEFSKRFGAATKKGRIQGWYGYEIVLDESAASNGGVNGTDPKANQLRFLVGKGAAGKASSASSAKTGAIKTGIAKTEIAKASVDKSETKAIPKAKVKPIDRGNRPRAIKIS